MISGDITKLETAEAIIGHFGDGKKGELVIECSPTFHNTFMFCSSIGYQRRGAGRDRITRYR